MSDKNKNKKYHAFISYRHADNKEQGRKWATWLHQAIETYEVPIELVGKKNAQDDEIPARIYPVFRDEQDLPAHADLANSITQALDSTYLLIVLCSPNAVASTYVADEIDYFKKKGRSDRIIAAMIAGEPNASWDVAKQQAGFTVEDECFPTPLQYEYDEKGKSTKKHAEPIAADFRINNNGRPEEGWTTPEAYKQHLHATTSLTQSEIEERVEQYQKHQHLMLLKIIAGMLGVPLSELTQRDREYQLEQERLKAKKLRRWLGAVAMLAMLAIGAGVFAVYEKEKAELNLGVAHYEKSKLSLAEGKFNESIVHSIQALKYGVESDIDRLKLRGLERSFSGHDKGIHSIAVSNNGKLLATSDGGGKIRLWDLRSGELIRTVDAHANYIVKIIFSNSGEFLASSSLDGQVKIWEVNSGSLEQNIGSEGLPMNLLFSEDEKELIVITSGDGIESWNIKKGSLISRAKPEKRFISDSVYYHARNYDVSSNGKWLASCGNDGKVRVYDIETGQVLKRFPTNARSVSFSDNGELIATGGMKGWVTLWDMQKEYRINAIKAHEGMVRVVAFSHNNTVLISGGADNKIQSWDWYTKNPPQLVGTHDGTIQSIELLSSGKQVISSGADNIVRLWNTDKVTSPTNIGSHEDIVTGIEFSPDGKWLVSSSFEQVKLHNVETGVSHTISDFGAESVSFSPDGNFLAIALDDVRLWDIKKEKVINTLKDVDGLIYDVSFSVDGTLLVTASEDDLIRVWDVNNAKVLKKWDTHQIPFSVSMSPKNDFIAYGNGDGSLVLKGIKSFKDVYTLIGHSASIKSIVFSPDGKYLATGGEDEIIRLWDIKKGIEVKKYTGHVGNIGSLAFSPSGKFLISGSTDNTIRVLDMATFTDVGVIQGHWGAVYNVAFSPDGKMIASSENDILLRKWDPFRQLFSSEIDYKRMESRLGLKLEGMSVVPY